MRRALAASLALNVGLAWLAWHASAPANGADGTARNGNGNGAGTATGAGTAIGPGTRTAVGVGTPAIGASTPAPGAHDRQGKRAPPSTRPDGDGAAGGGDALARALERKPRVDGVRVDDALIADAYERFARDKAAEVLRQDAEGIRRFLLEAATVKPGDIEDAEGDARGRYADALGVDEGDPRVAQLATQRVAAEKAALQAMAPALSQDPPDWGAALDIVVDMYRGHDALARAAFGADAAEELRVSELDGRAAILAIGASLAGRPWEDVSW